MQVFLRDTYGINQLLSIGHVPDEHTNDFTKYTKYALSVLDKKISQIFMENQRQLPNSDQINEAIQKTLENYNDCEKSMKVCYK